jgi:hypothetical protein
LNRGADHDNEKRDDEGEDEAERDAGARHRVIIPSAPRAVGKIVLEVDRRGDEMTRMAPPTSDDVPVKDSASIVRLGHVEYRVSDLERASHFYGQLLGFHETERDRDHIYCERSRTGSTTR